MLARRARKKVLAFSLQPSAFACAGFTMVEIAISLAIIGIALVAIIGVLPIGMRMQRDNREQTVINQDATVFLEAIRGGTRGMDDLTNYVYAITNYQTQYPSGTITTPAPGYDSTYLTNGARIIGLMSTPEYTDINGAPLPNLFNGGFSNHIVAFVRSISGPAVEKPPQDNSLLRGSSFTYRLVCASLPVQSPTNIASAYTTNLDANLRDLRLTFIWPVLPNGNLPPLPAHQTYRTMIAGQQALVVDTGVVPNVNLYFFQSQSFTNAP
jgi:prepilin-type N-terminal cleavage/methylation domain-containing protein